MTTTEHTSPTTCTVAMASRPGGICGAPAVTTFTSKMSGTTYGECAEHAPPSAVPTPVAPAAGSLVLRTRSVAPYALVAHGAIVGYAYSTSAAVAKRAAKLGARILPIVGGKVVVEG